MAAVYMARQLDLERIVALKELRVFRSVEPVFAQRFLREARLAGSFSHPNIVTVHDYFEFEGLPYIAMEYLPRGSLRRHVGRITSAQAGAVLEGVLAGLAHAERQHVVHRDIKPENLLVSAEGAVKIADFGIAKATVAVETGAMLTATGTTLGTPNYIAPEQALAHELGPWTDLYSLGLTTFELFAGRAPFADTQEPMAIVLRQLNEQVPRLSDVAPHVDRWMSDWVGWLASKSPTDRPRAAAQAWDALEELLIGQLGPRWRHGAQLPELRKQPPQSLSERPTRRRATSRLATTVPPGRPLVAPAPLPSRRRRRPPLKLAVAVLALVGAGFALAGHQMRPATTVADAVPGVVATDVPRSQPSSAQATATNPEPAATRNARALRDSVAPARAQARAYDGAANRIAKQSPGSSSDARFVAELRQVARDYRTAADAAAEGDLAAYWDALTAAKAGRKAVAGRLDAADGTSATPTKAKPTPTRSQPPVKLPQSPAPAPPRVVPTPAAPTQAPPSPCVGDSASDDPSDDECGE